MGKRHEQEPNRRENTWKTTLEQKSNQEHEK